ncbi:rhamnulose-1-phosphate aldolase [[Clostridium] symbiosum]|uniref:rhamnulose-1-phosphate aldolase n=1 Tax=Clostridium symbiosum TaxID=1512 RepID=UPI001D0934CB|nr:rhamnulose-1-phosphate aldolase [[Clostridium] symbiosum]MCB6607313.1 rhamnulose-1-phosphate aldolase [[Clostridium] symbiosum]MCB6929873.1 rhamnulose-1-phosphate aldolase [[Clostridium] symbiosum]
MKVLDSNAAKGFIRMSDDGWRLGWHECHGGNLSFRLTEEEVAEVREELKMDGAWTKLPVNVPELAGDFLYVTGSGKFMRNMTLDPEDSFGMIEIGKDGGSYRIVWGLAGGGSPTSELPAHLMNQAVKKRVTDGRYRVIYHAHPANIIALSFILPLKDEIFTRELWEMEPECAMTFPSGMGVLPWMVPGTAKIAELTCSMMEEYDVVLWAQHGLFAAGDSLDNTFGLMHTVEKAAEMLIKVLSVTKEKRQIPSVQDFKDMAEVFRLELPEKFLYDK